jgi:hypothetical protein
MKPYEGEFCFHGTCKNIQTRGWPSYYCEECFQELSEEEKERIVRQERGLTWRDKLTK